MSKKQKEQFEPFKHLEFSVALAFGIGHLDEDSENLIDKANAHILLEWFIFKFLVDC